MKFEAVHRPGGEQDDGEERGEERAAFLAELLHGDHAERRAVAQHGVAVGAGFGFAEEFLKLGFVSAAALEQALVGGPAADEREDERGCNCPSGYSLRCSHR